MRSGVIFSHFKNGNAVCQGWSSAFAVPWVTSDFGAGTSGRPEVGNGCQNPVRGFLSMIATTFSSSQPICKARETVASVRFAATSSTAPAKVDTQASVASSTEEDSLVIGLAQRYPDPNDIPEQVLQQIRRQLFGRPIRQGEQTGRRALARPLQGRALANWYFMPPSELPGFHNEEHEYEQSKALNRRHRKREGEEAEEAQRGKAGGKKK
ncbi:hypothetical protein Vretimale_4046 [Volvox reticuliferus]|uniref:Uncharacterized protein n=1 Tax=Volvox reticuliferus TaxID=1737510 RepID=A0A8J4BZ19_9CHLO|nr:hypothetical protein Vretifemale_1613 [Volvox reticuliferus]GIL98664.1 hypothetical protein Vretimale_4046 [Volvox reticuliferus]